MKALRRQETMFSGRFVTLEEAHVTEQQGLFGKIVFKI